MVAPVRVQGRPCAAGRRKRSRPLLAVLAALIVAALSTAGCVSMPTGGPVQSYPVTQGPDAQSNAYVQIQPQSPGDGWGPKQIVQGFLTASASFGNYGQVALQYLTPQAQQAWNHPTWSAVVYKSGPNVEDPVYPSVAKNTKDTKNSKEPKSPTTATVQVNGTIQATLKGNGNYKVPSAATTGSSSYAPQPFLLVKHGNQWRIQSGPPEVLLTSDSFAHDYQLRNLYFFDPTGSYLVPDPIYVPLRGPGDLMNGLVQDLITPPADWLSGGATKTALPADTKISGVTVDVGTAVVNLTGSIAKAATNNDLMQQVSSQLLWTLSGSGQSGSAAAVQSVAVELDGHPWLPPGSQGNPVQQKHQSTFNPPTGASSVYYYIDSAGYLTSRQGTTGKPERMQLIGPGYSEVAVSPDGKYLAALHGSTLYAGLIGGTLAKRGNGYVTMSWDGNDDLWAAQSGQVIMFHVAVSLRQPHGQLLPAAVHISDSNGDNNLIMSFTALRVAPDGVRVALVIGGAELTFGAISGQQGSSPRITLSQLELSPQNATEFTGLTWYGADNVITLAQQGPVVTEYAVSGGTPTSIPVEPGMKTITASSGNLLVAGLSDGHLVADTSLTGAWTRLGTGDAPAYPG